MINDNIPIKQRLHIIYGKFGALKYTGNLDTAKLWERVLRRAALPILYSEGFNPRPRIQLASALPLGITSECELLDVSLRDSIELDNLIEKLTVTSPEGLRIYTIYEVPVRAPAPQSVIRSAEYRITFEENVDTTLIQTQVEHILTSATVARTRDKKGKQVTDDIRPLIYDLRLDEALTLVAHLAVGEQGNLRPDDLLDIMGLADDVIGVHRFRLHFDILAWD